MFADFISHYSYTADQALGLFAKTYFALVAQMHRIKARESLSAYVTVAAAMSGGNDAKKVIDSLQKQEKGLEGILHEARTLREALHGN